MSTENERQGQIAFYERFLQAIGSPITIEDILSDNNDGVLNGNILEFKTSLSNLNTALFQSIKYLSSRRLKGKPAPKNIILIDLAKSNAYVYDSSNYLSEIETVYMGGASKGNTGFVAREEPRKFNFDSQADESKFINLLKSNEFTKINIDENCIVGWAEWFYREKPGARKEDFIGHKDKNSNQRIGEIRQPSLFKNFINPYKGDTNIKFEYLMDRLNDTIQKKDLGAFYTPPFYAKKAQELLMDAIARVPKDENGERKYIIIDRCAGTGNLEEGLPEEILKHCILSTYEYYEYKVLLEKFSGKVNYIIPPSDRPDTYDAGKVKDADALSENYIKNFYIKEFIDDPSYTIILFENPPYSESTSVEHQKRGAGKSSSGWKDSFVVREMRKEVKGTALNDLGNAFIWSGFKYYLRQPTDSYIVFSPAKYWKAQHLIDKKFLSGFAFNRRWFHTKIDACIMCVLWANEPGNGLKEFELQGFDWQSDKKGQGGGLTEPVPLSIKRTDSLLSEKYYDTRHVERDEKGLLCGLNGLEKPDGKGVRRETPIISPNILGYMVASGVTFDNPDLHCSLVVNGLYSANGFYLHRDNYLEKLPMFAASRYITYNRAWTERGRIMKSGDGAERFHADVKSGKLEQFLLKCLLFTCLEMQNHMRSFTGSDGHCYVNELCLDSIGGKPTQAGKDIQKLKSNEAEKNLLKLWGDLLSAAKKTKECNPGLTYGVYQIYAEIDVKNDELSKPGKTVWKHIKVHTARIALKEALKEYYNKEIVPVLFEYEFLK